MSYLDTASGQIVAAAPELERAAFIRRTYTHLAGAILAFAGLTARTPRGAPLRPATTRDWPET